MPLKITRPYNPDTLRLSKQELLDILGLLVIRWKNNPKVPRLFVKKYEADLWTLRNFVKEKDLPYFWELWCELSDELRAHNSRKGEKTLAALAPMQQTHLIEKLALPPEIHSELDAKKAEIMAAVRARLRYGSMPE